MKNKILNISKNQFFRNILIVVTGTAMAQAITMAFAPIITRMYGPESFGIQGVFIAMVGIISPIAALTYPIAIVLPKNDRDAKQLVRISLYVAGMMAALVTILLLFLKEQIVTLLQIETISSFLYLVPLVILFSAFLQVTQQWLIRTKQYKITAKVAFVNALFINISKIGFGFINPVAAVLIVISTFGNAFQAFMLFLGARSSRYKLKTMVGSVQTKMFLAKKHIDFPIYRAPQVFINAISQSIPVLLLSSLFGPASAGFYSLGRTVLSMPTQLIGKSVGDVFYPRYTEATNNGENHTKLLIKTTLVLMVVGSVPFGIVIVLGPWLFGVIFGTDWIVAGEYARWLALWTFFAFINRPTVSAIPVLNMQGKFLLYEIVSLIVRIAALLIGFFIYKNEIYAIAFFSLAGVILNSFLIIYTIFVSRARSQNKIIY